MAVSSYVTYPPEIQKLPRIGGIDDPNLETILALRPDLIVLRGGNPHVEELCGRHGIRLYRDQSDSLPTILMTIHDLGAIAGRMAEAEQVATKLQEQIATLARKTAGRPQPRVLFTIRSPDKLASITTVGKPSFLHDLIAAAGGENIFGDTDLAYPQVSLEEIIARRPDVIVEAMPGETLDDVRRAAIKAQWRELSSVPAVASGRIEIITEDFALIPSLRIGMLAERLEAIFRDAPKGK